jgi:5-methylthioadenosine/S-adenosylhomocysteine deaminase
MIAVDVRIDARWIIPVVPPGALHDHSLLIDEGRIVAVVPTTSAERDYAAATHVVLGTHALLPGLINAHTHGAMTLFRGIADDVPLATWLHEHIWPHEARFVSAEFVHDGTLLAAGEMIRGGITCCHDMYFFPDAAARAYDIAGMRAVLGLPILDFPTPYAADADAYLQAGLAARDAWKREPRLAFSLAPHAPYTVSDASWATIITFARQLDMPIQTHLLETADEREQSIQQHGLPPLQRLHRLGATGPGFIAIHAVHVNASDMALLAEYGCQVVHCPISNLKLASGIAPVTQMQKLGINVALGTDGSASNNRLDMFGEARAASLLAKVVAHDAAALPAAAVLRMATLDGATALGLDRDIGSLERGKFADVIAVDLGGFEHAPCYDPVSHLVHVTGRDQVSDVWVAGEQLLASGTLTRMDINDLSSRARLWHERLK